MRRLIRSIALHLMLAAAFWASVSMSLASGAFAQEGPNRAALVVRFEDGSLETHCFSFSEPFISGMELLTRSGLQVRMDSNSGLGGAICSIRDRGCAYPIQDCFCRCQGSACEYWAYYHWADDHWQYSQIGASGYRVTDGALEGWAWGPGDFSRGTEPPRITFDQVCAVDKRAAFPAAASTEASTLPVGSFLVPAVHAQDLAANPKSQSETSTPATFALTPSYAAYLLLATTLTGAALWVTDRRQRRKKAPATASSGWRRS